MKKRNKRNKGFTLIELIVVIAILGILAAIMIPRFSGFQDKARTTQAVTDAKQIATAMDSVYAEENDWDEVTTDKIDALTGDLECTYELLTDAGGFKASFTEGGKTYSAGRADKDSPIEDYPVADAVSP